jgi:hypothetical protein
VALEYGPSAGAQNEVTTGSNVQTTVTMRCVKSAPGCSSTLNSYNALNVKASSDVGMLFARVLGIKKLKVKASATACSPCSVKPLDIMLVLDRTGSMCQFNDGRTDPNCTDLNTAKGGIREFLGYMDPNLDWVGLSVFPPALDDSWVATCPYKPWTGNPPGPTPDGRRYGYDARWSKWNPPPGSSNWAVYDIASITNDYLVQSGGSWIPNPGSALNQRLGCADGAGTTQYANAIDAAQHELGANGRGDVQDVIVFLSDGAANTTPRDLPSYIDNPTMRLHPCAAGVGAAGYAKQQGTIIYTIGYDLEGQGGAYENCKLYPSGANDSSITAWDAIRAMATEPDNFYDLTVPNPRAMNRIFTRIAADLQRPAARLIDDDLE